MSVPLNIIADQQIAQARETFSSLGMVTLVDGRKLSQRTLKKADVLLVRSVTKVNETLLNNTPIKFVGSATSGIDHIDQPYLDKNNIHFVHAPGSNACSVAEYVLSSLFIIAELNEFSLADKTVGIIGHGQVGTRIKHFLSSLGAHCLINDPPLALEKPKENFVELDTLKQADIITLHVPLATKGSFPTRELIDANFLSGLKSDVILINTSRGEVINETDLISFKQNRPDANLVLDVWCNEPDINLELLQQTLIATPHIAGYSLDGKLKAARMLFDALNKLLNNNVDADADKLIPDEGYALILEDDFVHSAVLQSYDVRSDAIALRNLFSLRGSERVAYFDEQRKHYPVRREFKQHKILSKTIDKKSATQLKQLGFNLEMTC